MDDATTEVDGQPATAPERSADIDALLDGIQRESEQRRRALQALAAELPAVQSRRVVVVAMLRDVRATANVKDIAARAGRKLLRAPRAIVRRLGGR